MSKLIFGCGYLGLRVGKLWRDRGEEVYAVTRTRQRGEQLRAFGIAPIVADVTDRASLADLPTAETVLFAVGFDRSAGHSIGEVYAEGLKHVLAALPEATKRVIYISSTGVYGQMAGEEVDETSACEPTREGGQAALAAERVLRASRFGARGTILRLAGIYGPGRIPHGKTLRAGEAIPTPPDGYLNLIHVDDAARVVLAAECAAAAGGLYCVADDEPALRRDYYARLAELLETDPPVYSDDSASGAARSRGAGSKRIRNGRMRSELQYELVYRSYREGLAAIVAEEAEARAARSRGSGP